MYEIIRKPYAMLLICDIKKSMYERHIYLDRCEFIGSVLFSGCISMGNQDRAVRRRLYSVGKDAF